MGPRLVRCQRNRGFYDYGSQCTTSAGFDDLALLLTVGEEESSDGAKSANNLLKNRARFLVVVSQPSSKPRVLKKALWFLILTRWAQKLIAPCRT